MVMVRRRKAPAAELEPVTEALAQDLVWSWCKQSHHEITVPNCGMAWGYESDVASVTRARLGHEFEIKVSRADWLSELRQVRGERKTAKRERARALLMAREIAQELARVRQQGKHHAVIGGRWYGYAPPSYFWMVTAPDIIKPDELPDYAGLMEIATHPEGYRLRPIKPAPRLHTLKMNDAQLMAMARGVTLRYWQLRRQGKA